MKKRHLILFGLLFFLATNILSQTRYSLSSAVDSALANNNTVKLFKAKVMEMTERKQASVGNYLPKLSLYAGYTYFSDNMKFNTAKIKSSLDDILSKYGVQISNGLYPLPPEINGSIYTTLFNIFQQFPAYDLVIDQQQFPTAQLTLTQPLFTGGKIIAASDFSSTRYKTAKIKLKLTENEIIKQTVKEYLGIALLNEVVKVRRNAVNVIKKDKRVAIKLYAEGIIPKYYLLRADVALQNAELELQDTENKLHLAELALKSTLGLPEQEPIELTDSLKFIDFDIDLQTALTEADSLQPLLKIVDQMKEESEIYKDLKRSKFFPDIFAYARYGFFLKDKPLIMPPWILGVEMRLNIFNGFKDYHQLEAAKFLTEQAKFAKLEAKDKINLWVNKTVMESKQAKDKYLKMGTSLKLALQNYQIVSKRFEQGMATSLEVVDAILAYEGARVKRLSTLYDYYQALLDLNFATGNPMKIVMNYH